MSKYNNRICYADSDGNLLSSLADRDKDDVQRFDSLFEYKIWQILRRYFEPEQICRQVPYCIKPKTDKFPPVVWKPDFTIESPTYDRILIVEAKGFSTSEYILKLKLFELNYPWLYDKLEIVHSGVNRRKIDTKGKTCHTLQTFELLLENLTN